MDASNFRPQPAPSLWALGLSAALVAVGFRRRDETDFPPGADRGGVKTEADAPERRLDRCAAARVCALL